jgi:hypothetical protein
MYSQKIQIELRSLMSENADSKNVNDEKHSEEILDESITKSLCTSLLQTFSDGVYNYNKRNK